MPPSAELDFGSLYGNHHTWLQGWLRRKLGCALDAADLAHDTFLRVLAGRELADIREPRAYLTTVAHGLMVNHLRRCDIERACLDALASLPEPLAPSPEVRALAVELLLEIDTMLDGLSCKVRAAFLLSQLDGLSYAEIAGQLGVSVSMVRKYMLQAISHCLKIRHA